MLIILVSLISVVTGGGILSINERKADNGYLFDGCCRGKAKPMRALGDMSHAKCLSECKKDSKCIALETSGWTKKTGQYGSCKLFGRNPDSRQKEITNGGCNSSGWVKCYEKLNEKEQDVPDYEYLFDGCCRGKAKPMRSAGDMSHAKCASECKKESKCIALETSGWTKKTGQYGSCKLFGRNPDSRQKEITNGGCNSSGWVKCYGKIDKKEKEEKEEKEVQTDNDWCCSIVKKYPDMIPHRKWGAGMQGKEKREWGKRSCDGVVGGSTKHLCPDLATTTTALPADLATTATALPEP